LKYCSRSSQRCHPQLDREVEKDAEDDLGDVSDLSSNLQYVAFLSAIAARGKDMEINLKYLDIKVGKDLITTHGELRAMLASAWRHKSDGSYREIRASVHVYDSYPLYCTC